MSFDLNFPLFHGQPPCRGRLRSQAEDFQVDELLGFTPSGEGEHVYLQVRKRNQNTQWLANQLAAFAGVRPQDVSFAGLKDRYALTTQWFSVWLPGKASPDWSALNDENIEILNESRHSRKLKRGGHLGNAFKIRLRELQVDGDLDARLNALKNQGVPNYFGEQRFGHEGMNLVRAEALLSGQAKIKNRQQRGFALSAARSYLFNLQVAERIQQQCFDQVLAGDRCILDGTTNLVANDALAEQGQLVAELKAHPSGVLPGRGRSVLSDEALALENKVLQPFQSWIDGLEKFGLVNERRAIRTALKTLNWHWVDDDLVLEFVLPSGCFATAVIRELCDYRIIHAEDNAESES